MASNKIEIQIQPGPSGRLRLQDFVRGLDAIIAALRATELTITGLDRPQTEFDVVDLHHSKPTVVIQGYTSPLQRDYSGRTIKRFIGAVNDITRGRAPKWMDLDVLETYKDLAEPLNENVHHVVITNSKKRADITPRYKERIEKI